MPPKQPAKGRSAKSGKLSKAEKEKLRKEEAERKAREEEEARLKEEQEKREQEERERVEREEKQKLWEAERARHQAELDEIHEIMDNNSHQLKSLEEAHRSKAKWDRYMLCDGSPDPMMESELNTFMHLWRDESLPKSTRDILLECENTLKLISELEFHIQDSVQEAPSEEESQRYKESVKMLQHLIGFKIDRATMYLLLSASDNVDPESQNLQYTTSTEHVTLCLWGNTAKNPRLKTVTFDKQGFNIDISKSLALGDVSIRVLLTAYDHLSPLAKSFYPKQKKVPEVVVEVTVESEEDKKEVEGEEELKEQDEDQHNTITPKSASVVSRSSKASKSKSGRTGSSKSNKSRKASAKSAKSQSSEQTSQKELAPEPEEPPADDAVTNDEVPPEISNLEELDDEDDDEDDDDVVDLRSFGVVGPIMFLELLELPPQPKHVKTWTIQQIVSPDLQRLPYQTQSSSTAPGSASSTGPHPTSASNTNMQASNPPLAINLRLPGNVVYFEQPQLAWWEPAKNQWRLDGISDIKYNEDERTMSFKTVGFGPIVTTQDLYLNMPFQSWEIRPHKTNSCVFTVIAAIIEMEIEIQDGVCCLAQPDDIEELTPLIGKWMKPKELMEALRGAGVNVFPAEDAEKYVSINKKDEKLVKEVYQEIALTASAYAYSWSKWNAESSVDKIVLQTAEQLQDEMLLEEDWSLYLLTTQSSCKLKMKEEDAEFSDNIADNTQLHSNLYHMVKDGATQAATRRIQDSNFLFVDCVYQLLSATKVITYS